MAKLIVILALVVAIYRWLRGRWPWEPARDKRRSWARAQASALLGVGDGASREDIIDAHRRLIARVHPDRGGTNALVHEANSARDLLLGEIALRDKDRV